MRPLVKSIDRVGEKHGRLVILEVESRNNRSFARVRCDCGIEKQVRIDQVIDGTTISCGCANREYTAARCFRHGMARTNIYKIWHGMISRCRNQKRDCFANYGGRGITVCDRWKDFNNFYEDMGNRPSSKHTLERKDNDGDYSPGNCKWALRFEQLRNTRRNRKYEWHGQFLCLSDLAAISGLHRATLHHRLANLNWPIEEAMSIPANA